MYTALSPVDEPTTRPLERPLDELVSAPVVARMRRLRLALMVGGAIGLIPWIVFLVSTLPANDVALGFDVLLVAFMVTTGVLVFLRRQLVLLTAFTTGVLLISDAAFDVMTAGPHDLWESALTATLVELPLAVILITTALRILRLRFDWRDDVASQSLDGNTPFGTIGQIGRVSGSLQLIAPGSRLAERLNRDMWRRSLWAGFSTQFERRS
jgi:hypothetical protein